MPLWSPAPTLDLLIATWNTNPPRLTQSSYQFRRFAFQWVRTVHRMVSPALTIPRFWIESWELSGFLQHQATGACFAWAIPNLRIQPDAWLNAIRIHPVSNLHNSTGGPDITVTLSELPAQCHQMIASPSLAEPSPPE